MADGWRARSDKRCGANYRRHCRALAAQNHAGEITLLLVVLVAQHPATDEIGEGAVLATTLSLETVRMRTLYASATHALVRS